MPVAAFDSRQETVKEAIRQSPSGLFSNERSSDFEKWRARRSLSDKEPEGRSAPVKKPSSKTLTDS